VRDRFPLLLIAGFVLIGVLGSTLFRNASRGEFAGELSTYRSEAKGARALYLLAEESGLPVAREKRDLQDIEPDAALVLLGVRATPLSEETEHLAAKALKGHTDGGTDGSADGGTEERERAGTLDEILHGNAFTAEEQEKVLEHVKEGHTLVYVPYSKDPDRILDAVNVRLETPPEMKPALRTLVPARPTPYTLGVERVEAELKYALSFDLNTAPLLVDDQTGAYAAAVAPYGNGRVVVLGTPELAMNPALTRADNARLWLSLLSAARGPKDRLRFDEYHHGFREGRSVAAFAARYGLHFAVAQLLFGLCLWAASLRRFGRPHAPPEQVRVGGADVLSAAGRLYRAGKHHAHAAQLIAEGLSQDLASPAGLPLRARPEEVEAGLRGRGRADLAAGLAEVGERARSAKSDHDVLETARTAARVRLLLKPHRSARRAQSPRR